MTDPTRRAVIDAARATRRAPAGHGPYTGKHVRKGIQVLPPEWDMTPAEYESAIESDRPVPRGDFVFPMGMTLSGSVASGMPIVAPAVTPFGGAAGTAAALVVGAIAFGTGAGWLTGLTRTQRRWRKHSGAVLAHRNPAEAINISGTLPHHVWNLLHEVVSLHDISPEGWRERDQHGFKIVRAGGRDAYAKQRAMRLEMGYRLARLFQRPAGADMWTMQELIEAHPEEMRELAEVGAWVDTFTARASAKVLLGELDVATRRRADMDTFKEQTGASAALGATVAALNTALGASASPRSDGTEGLDDVRAWHVKASKHGQVTYADKWTGHKRTAPLTAIEHLLLRQATSAPRAPSTQTAQSEASRFETQWDEALAAHDRVSEQWTELVTDPLAALDHSMLLDVTQPRTAAFIEAYGEAQDLRSMHGTAYPTSATADTVVREYLRVVRRAEQAWTDAVRHAKHVHTNWLPQDEAKRVRQASALLRTADDDTTPLHLRAEAAQKAADLLKQVHTFTLPADTAQAIEAKARLALPAGS